MKRSAVSKRYARALVDIAASSGAAAALADSLSGFADVINKSKDLHHVLANPVFRIERLSVIKGVCKQLGLDELAVRAISYLIERDRIQYLEAIVESMRNLIEQHSGRLRAEVISAKELPEDRYQRIRAAMERITGGLIVLEKSIDPSLIGGIITRVGSVVYDGSIRSQLRHFNTEK